MFIFQCENPMTGEKLTLERKSALNLELKLNLTTKGQANYRAICDALYSFHINTNHDMTYIVTEEESDYFKRLVAKSYEKIKKSSRESI